MAKRQFTEKRRWVSRLKRDAAETTAPATDSDKAPDGTFGVAKWLIPTFGVLFALIGFSVRTAHRSLLGFPVGLDTSDSAYTADASDFLRHVVTLFGDSVLRIASLQTVTVGDHGRIALMCALITVLAVGFRFSISRAEGPRSGTVFVLAVAVLLGSKFIVFDAPLMRVENVVVGTGIEASTYPGEPVTRSLMARLSQAQGGILDELITSRARDLWRLLVCSRITISTANPDHESLGSCQGGISKGKSGLNGEFNVVLLLGSMVAICAAMLLSLGTRSSTAVALFALAYLLTIPYAYGKLVKPVYFPYALVSFEPGSLHGRPKKDDRAFAFVLSRANGEVTLLETVDEVCSSGSRKVLRFSSLPMSSVSGVEQIFLKDVISWAVLSERSCSPILPPSRGTL